MLDTLADGFKKASDKLKGIATLTDENLASSISEIQNSLLEADVEYSIAKKFTTSVLEKVVGTEVKTKAGRGQKKLKTDAGGHFVKICHEELKKLMGEGSTHLNYASGTEPTIIMLAGLQGTGKTTTCAKLAAYLSKVEGKKPLLVAADIYRPAAVNQLKVLGERIDVPVFHIEGANPVDICAAAKKEAKNLGCDVIIFDTAGRLTIDEDLMEELQKIKTATTPHNILLVCDAMMGQDAVTTAKAFNEKLEVSGFIMTKLDGDSRGGAALSIKEVTGSAIKFVGLGEEIDRFEEFRPDGLASRILGMGDIVGLMQDFDRVVEEDKEEDALRMLQGQFNFKDFYEQISMIQKMGPLKDVLSKLPMQNMIPKDANIDASQLNKIKSIIDSMTEKERLNPTLFNESRMKRVAQGSGRSLNDVKDLYNRFKTMKSMMGSLGKNLGGLMGKIPGMGNSGGGGGLGSMMNQDFAGLSSMLNPNQGQKTTGLPKKVDREKLRKARKAAKNSRKKNRKR